MLNKVGPIQTPSKQLDQSNDVLVIESQSPERNRQGSAIKLPIDIAFKNITYSIQVDKKVEGLQIPCKKQKEQKVILNKVSGIIKGGEVSAILGASGAGKTSLLNILACRINYNEGKLLANKTEYDYNSFGDFANYVMQTDVLMQTLTVKQTLMFAADLRLNKTEEEKQRRVMDLARSMKLQKCLETMVGGAIVKGISGGEKKRTSIAFQLISNPQVIMLDQPTSGLDSLTSFVIVDYLKKLAREEGRTILMTIHQPSMDIYQQFDRLFLMVQGQIVYQGQPLKGIDYFQQNFSLRCKQFQNPAQFFIEHTHHQTKSNVNRYASYFQKYDKIVGPQVDKQINECAGNQISCRQIQVGCCNNLKTLLKRDLINLWRNPMLLKSRLFQSVFIGIFVGGLYFDAGTKDYTQKISWNSMTGLLFFMNITMLMQGLAPIVLVFPTEREVFLKEQNSRLYNTVSYFLSRNIIEIPYLVIMPVIFILIFYWMIDLSSTAQQFLVFYLIGFLIGLCGNSIGLLLGSLIADPKVISATMSLVILPFVLIAGFFKNLDNLPAWVGWIQYLSPLKFGFGAMVYNQTKNKASLIGQLNLNVDLWPSVGYLILLAFGFRMLSLLFLWLMRTKVQ